MSCELPGRAPLHHHQVMGTTPLSPPQTPTFITTINLFSNTHLSPYPFLPLLYLFLLFLSFSAVTVTHVSPGSSLLTPSSPATQYQTINFNTRENKTQNTRYKWQCFYYFFRCHQLQLWLITIISPPVITRPGEPGRTTG